MDSLTLRDQTCCFTGHRKLLEDESTILERTNIYLSRLLQENVRFFWLGGALGFDTLMAMYLLDCRRSHPQIKIYLALPFEGYRSRWSAPQQARAAQIDALVDGIIICSHSPSKWAFLRRNRYMVDQSRYCISYCSKSTGGTAYTIRYAKKDGLTVWNTGHLDLSAL